MSSQESSLLSANAQTSAELFKKACEVIPGGVTANIKYFSPHPLMMEKGNGSKLFDVDGNEYIDYLLCYGALILGHGHQQVFNAVTKQMMESGTTIFGTPHKMETTMAEKLVELYPGIDMVRYTNSGLEATLLAIRTAVAYTGKQKIAKFEGHYHGGYDQVLVSVNPDIDESGDATAPKAIGESRGLPDYYLENTVILPFNDLEASEKILRAHAHKLACVILEPIQGGFIPADQDFMTGLRKITEELDIVLIFDEVKTGFRVSLGGAQKVYGIKPDITALGKVLGGGFPVGAIGGKKEIMMISSAIGSRDILTAGEKNTAKQTPLYHSGTYNGHPTILAAGLATINVLEQEGTMKKLFANTDLLRSQLEKLYQSHGLSMQTIGMGSIFNIILGKGDIKNYRDMMKADTKLRKRIDYELLHLGVYTKPLNRYSMSVVHTEKDIQHTVAAHDEAIKLVLNK
ncbi:aspartate aminotransferase family protein [Bacillus sp. FSL H8-0516]|uniref:aspartate aminotransferase family protein n=1 Tax=Bacillus TaxID=1386 RepID=UPI0005CB710A|nr:MULTISPECIES: aspartate aminotransferase family protein [Bacillus]KIZ53753.1 glutamate-1-semialdehyde 2,1-aminomutase [Bacillus safensis]PNU23624.1 aspartate aminotransferase family protein [Bacillus stratosphericus]TDU16399.1 glutamate-1-semialdehyde 2,1-aminomutase [Bacillus sp. BK450]